MTRVPRSNCRSLACPEQGIAVELFVGRSMLQPDLAEVHLQLLGDQHRDGCVGALAHLDIGHGQDDLPVAFDADEGVGREAIGAGASASPFANGRLRLSIRPPPAAAPARRNAAPRETVADRDRPEPTAWEVR